MFGFRCEKAILMPDCRARFALLFFCCFCCFCSCFCCFCSYFAPAFAVFGALDACFPGVKGDFLLMLCVTLFGLTFAHLPQMDAAVGAQAASDLRKLRGEATPGAGAMTSSLSCPAATCLLSRTLDLLARFLDLGAACPPPPAAQRGAAQS